MRKMNTFSRAKDGASKRALRRAGERENRKKGNLNQASKHRMKCNMGMEHHLVCGQEV